jgi:DNA-binding PadR family transcriptional regulator
MALLIVIGTLGEAHGYAIMQALKDRVGGGWQPSPGAIYPALLTLQDIGLVEARERDGSRVYRLTERGKAVASEQSGGQWESLSARAKIRPSRTTLTRLLRDFQGRLPQHRAMLTEEQASRVQRTLTQAAAQIRDILNEPTTGGEGETDGRSDG